ncbi:MAG: DegT/DnrJ/EryC1/StrS family aminotransferase, partial [Candidatus Binataceae bacterium]
LRRADELKARRAAIARAYNEAFRDLEALQTPYAEPGVDHAWHLYVLRIRPPRLRIDRAQFVEVLHARGVNASVHCIPLHTMDFYQRRYGYRNGDFPVAEDVFSRCLSLPIFPALSQEELAYVIETVRATVSENLR